MATGWRDLSLTDLAKIGKGNSQPATAKPAKYRNVKEQIDGIVWDSGHEAARYQDLLLLQRAGAIRDLRWKIAVPLKTITADGRILVAAHWIADFIYTDAKTGLLVWEDAKAFDAKTGKFRTTAEFRLKAKWLYLQDGIEIQLV